jgi:hypothetical protein
VKSFSGTDVAGNWNKDNTIKVIQHRNAEQGILYNTLVAQ